jgi:HEAT repeat protein
MRAPIAALVLLLSRCSSPSADEEPPLFESIAALRARYDVALDSQDSYRVEAEAATLNRLARERFEEVLQGLSSADPATRESAAFALGFSSSRTAIEPLAAATSDASPVLRAYAIAALGMLRFREVPTEPFRRLLADDAWQVRMAALFGLRHLAASASVLDALPARIADPVAGVRNETVLVLGRIATPAALEMLLDRPIRDPEPVVRQNAAKALGSIRRPAEKILPALKAMLHDGDPDVVRAAEASLRWVEEGRVDTPAPDR